MPDLSNVRVAILATDGVEESELTEPARVLGQEHAKVFIIAPRPAAERGRIQAFRHLDKGHTLPVDSALDQANPDDYDALLLPGGALSADQLRGTPRVAPFVRSFDERGKPMAIICHAPWILISARLCRGRTLTGYHTIEDDIRNAGGFWQNAEVVLDRNWVSSRSPKDLPAFCREMVALFATVKGRSEPMAPESPPAASP